MLGRRASLQAKTAQVEANRIRVIQFNILIGAVIAAAVRIRHKFGKLRRTQTDIRTRQTWPTARNTAVITH